VTKDDLTADDFRALAEFRYQIRRFLHFSEKAALARGLSPQQHQLLLALKGLPEGIEPTIGNLAERLHLRHHSAVELTNRLAANGLVRKLKDHADRRQVLLQITQRGERALRQLSLAHRAQLQSAGKTLIRSVQKLLKDNEGLHEEHRTRKDHLKRTR
jgi:DNA-binding MarR family transcriptional regulator